MVRRLNSEYFVFGLTVLFFIVAAPFTPGLASTATLLNLLGYSLPLLIVAIGMTIVMITGGIDLSVTSIIALTSVVGAELMAKEGGTPVVVGVVAMLGLGAMLGALNGVVIAFMRLPAFIVTLASMMFFSGFAVWFTQSKNIYGLPHSFLSIGKLLPVTVTVTLFVAGFAHFVLGKTTFGRWLYAIGQNPVAAHVSGLPVRSIAFMSYVTSGVCAALASVILTGRLETGSPVLGKEILLDIIGATVVGGTSLFGGRGKIIWTCFGVIFLTVLDNALNHLNLSQFTITMTKGGVILFAAVLDATRRRFAGSAS